MYWNGDNFGEFVVLNITQDTEPSLFPPVDSIWIQNLTKDNKLELSRRQNVKFFTFCLLHFLSFLQSRSYKHTKIRLNSLSLSSKY